MKTAIMILMTVFLAAGVMGGEAAGQSPPPIPSEEQPEVLTRGPLNEAFAHPVNLEIQAGLTVRNAPPEDIDEYPSSERPVGDHFSWVPGYWAWDSDRNGYIWVSGCWRAVPPNMHWVPGYWSQTREGYQWVSGFWSPIRNTEIAYLTAPPELRDVEAYGPPPSADRLWVPPCWYWYQGQYVRRPGYWMAANEDWVWMPSHYVRTPRGYVFVEGYWDYTMDRRGVLYAPVYFPNRTHASRRTAYPLSITVNIGNLSLSLFTRPQYSHYYFGDYYDSSYLSIGIFPWFEFNQRHTWYDPIYVQNRWRRQRDEPRWEEHQHQEYDRRRADQTLRPPRTYREMESRVRDLPEPRQRDFQIVEPITRAVSRKATPFKFEEMKPEARKEIVSHSKDVHSFVQERSRWETQENRPKTSQTRIDKPPAIEPAKTPQPEKRNEAERKPSERMEAPPAPSVQTREPPARSRESREEQTSAPAPQKQTKVSAHQATGAQPDKVKLRTSPVVGKKDKGLTRGKNPSPPAEEKNIQKTRDEDKARDKEKNKEEKNKEKSESNP
jgi:hypothetical protein